MITSKQISEAIRKIAKKEGGVETQKFVEHLSKFAKKHFLQSLLPGVVHSLEQSARREQSSNTLRVKTAHKADLSKNTEGLIRQKLAAEDAPLEVREDKNILAGFVAEYDSKILDGSAKTQIKKLKNSFNKF